MPEVVKGDVIAEGKTKVLHDALARPGLVIVENKTAITAFDDPSRTQNFAAKARFATTTTCRVFELLRRDGQAVAFEQQLGETEFLARRLQMIPLEVVVRRYAVGSYLNRHPEFKKPEGEVPHSFYPVKSEAFLKTTGGKLTTLSGEVLNLGLDAQRGQEDPFILNPFEEDWRLFHPKKEEGDPAADLRRTVSANTVLKHRYHMQMILNMAASAFVTLEEAWSRLGCYLIDYKVEFGYDASGEPVLGDVIDNDSWRLRTKNWEELSKQSFRDGEALSEVERKYGTVAELVMRPEFLAMNK